MMNMLVYMPSIKLAESNYLKKHVLKYLIEGKANIGTLMELPQPFLRSAQKGL